MSANPLYTAGDYQTALLALLPVGRSWPKDPASVQGMLALALAQGFERLDARAQQLLVDAFPPTAVELLPEWESSLGLPDPCAGQIPILSQRQAQVVARLTDTGGQSAPRFIHFAGELGYAVTITEFAPFRAGVSVAGSPDYGVAWANALQITAALNTVTFFAAGRSAAGEPLADWGNAVLQCELSARLPAHVAALFAYA